MDKWQRMYHTEHGRVQGLQQEVREGIRNEERVRVEYGQQVKDLRRQVLELKAKVRKPHVQVHMYMYTYMYRYTCICTYTCVYVLCACACTCIYVCVYIHVCVYMYCGNYL